jgi:hypothetical protein
MAELEGRLAAQMAAQRAELEGQLVTQQGQLVTQQELLAAQQEEIARLRARRTEAPASSLILPGTFRSRGAVGAGDTEDAASQRANGRPTSRRGLLKLGSAAAAGVAAAVAAPQLAAAHPAMPADNPGVFTADASLGHGVAVSATGSNGANGVNGVSDSANGVLGISTKGAGVLAISETSADIVAVGTGRISQKATIFHAGPPTAADGTFVAGEQIRDYPNYALWICTHFGTPGTWRQVAALAPGYAGGSLNLLPSPIRLLDTRAGAPVGNLRPGAPVAYHGTINVPTAGVTYQMQTIPAGAVAVFGLLTAALAPGVDCGDGSSAIAYAAGATRPAAVNVVYNPQDLHGAYTSDFTMVPTGSGGDISIYNQPINVVAVDYLFDCFGFVM